MTKPITRLARALQVVETDHFWVGVEQQMHRIRRLGGDVEQSRSGAQRQDTDVKTEQTAAGATLVTYEPGDVLAIPVREYHDWDSRWLDLAVWAQVTAVSPAPRGATLRLLVRVVGHSAAEQWAPGDGLSCYADVQGHISEVRRVHWRDMTQEAAAMAVIFKLTAQMERDGQPLGEPLAYEASGRNVGDIANAAVTHLHQRHADDDAQPQPTPGDVVWLTTANGSDLGRFAVDEVGVLQFGMQVRGQTPGRTTERERKS